jgi:hypothetical protein
MRVKKSTPIILVFIQGFYSAAAIAQPSTSPEIMVLQRMIDSGAAAITVQPGTYTVAEPIELRPTLRTLDLTQVTLEAAEGAFLGSTDALMRIHECKNLTIVGRDAVLRMRRADYREAPYFADDGKLFPGSQHRHGIDMRGSDNVRIWGLAIEDTGGDGIYVGPTWDARRIPNTAIGLFGVTITRAHRNGISVISANGLTGESLVIRDVAGTSPQAAIDVEPANLRDSAQNIVFRNVLSDGVRGAPYIVAIARSNATSSPVGVRFEQCRAERMFPDQTELRLSAVISVVTSTDGLVYANGLLRPDLPATSIEYNGLLWTNRR